MDDTVSVQALRESEELHRITLLSMSDAVFITTDAGLFTFICPNVDVIFGYSHDEVRAMERGSPAAHDQIAKMASETADLCEAIHRLSHNLHPSRLEHLGLETSIRTLCRELTETRQIEVDLRIGEMPDAIQFDTALCLYRIAQEALHNIVKHSGASRAVIGLGREAQEMVMSVADDGAGFDPATARRKGTLGLISMRERARLVQAALSVTSMSGHGTRLEVRAPLPGS